MNPRRFPNRVYGQGTEPDPRFSLANERTFLAWIRTSLALIAAGVALKALQLPIREDLRTASAGILLALGLIAPVNAWIGWMRAERAMRLELPLPAPSLAALLAVGIIVAGVLIVVGMVL